MLQLNVKVMRLTAALAIGALGAVGGAQTTGAPAPQDLGPKVGDVAPDFSLPGSTKEGKLAKPVHLSDLKGQVVVLAFFPKARTSG